MKKISWIGILGAAVALIGLVAMLGWLLQIKMIVTPLVGYYNIVFNTSFCFFLVGMSFVCLDMELKHARSILRLSGFIILIISTSTLSQDIFNWTLGIDQLIITDWTHDPNPYPGRMAGNTAISLILIAINLILLSIKQNKPALIFIQLSALALFLLGFITVLGYLFDLDFIYRWNRYTHMALMTAIALMLSSVCFWLYFKRTSVHNTFFENREDKKILVLSIIILTSVAILSGLLGFFITARQDEIVAESFLQENLGDRVDELNQKISKALQEIELIAKPDVIENTFLKNESNDKLLSKILLDTSFYAIRLYDKNDKAIYSEGEFISSPYDVFSVNMLYHADLIYKHDLFLQLSADVNHKTIKKVVMQWSLDSILQNARNSKSRFNRQYFLCFEDKKSQLNCLPNKNSGYLNEKFMPTKTINQILNAINNSDSITVKNYINQDRMLLSYRPIKNLKFGILAKSDLEKVYQSIIYRFLFVFVILVLTVLIGTAVLYLVVAPLVRKVKNSEAEFRSVFDSSPIGMGVVSLQGYWLNVNNALSLIFGYTKNEFLKMKFNNVVHPEDIHSITTKVRESLTGSINNFRLEKRFIKQDDSIIWITLDTTIIRNIHNEPMHFVCQLQDITKQKEYEEKLNYQARHDALTGLVNRAELDDRLSQIIAKAKRSEQKFAVFFLDLDRFKEINDTLGHDAGDRLLKVIAERLKGCVRKVDVVARLGGDEFVLVLTDLHDYKSSALFADRIINALLVPTRIKGQEIYATSSIGISFYPTDGGDASTLIKNADHALYLAKQAGRNNYQFCESDISSQIREKMTFESDLKNAIDKDEFKMYYLPQIDPTYKSVVGVEGLLRWQSDQYGLVTPQSIIPAAEETGLIIPLSEWIIKTACEQVKKWQDAKSFKLHLSINMSARHYMHERVIESIMDNLQVANFDPSCFWLEINETLIMQDPNKTLEIINALKRYGIKIVIDNFGTGYSSFTYLQDFRVDAIKLDKSLIKEIGLSMHREQLIQAIIKFASDLRIKVVAEGVETQAQFDFLVNAGCDELQGYFICRPMLAHEVSKFLDEKRHITI